MVSPLGSVPLQKIKKILKKLFCFVSFYFVLFCFLLFVFELLLLFYICKIFETILDSKFILIFIVISFSRCFYPASSPHHLPTPPQTEMQRNATQRSSQALPSTPTNSPTAQRNPHVHHCSVQHLPACITVESNHTCIYSMEGVTKFTFLIAQAPGAQGTGTGTGTGRGANKAVKLLFLSTLC